MTAPTRILNPSRWQIAFAMDCNLRCSYCSSSFGTYGTQKGHMPRKTWERFIEFALGHSHGKKNITFEFGIGETFLFFNEFLSMVRTLNTQAEKVGMETNVSVSTNGTLLDKRRLDILAAEDISLTFSIDGPQHIHDNHRKDMNGKGSYKKAIENWEYYKKLFNEKSSNAVCNITSVLTKDSSLPELIDFWKDKGESIFSCKVQLPGSESHNCSKSEWKTRQEQYLIQLKKYAGEMASQLSVPWFLSDYKGPQDLYLMWQQLFLEQQRHPCNAGVDVAAVDISGNIYPCEYFIPSEKWCLGDIFKGFSPSVVQLFAQSRNKALAICEDCPIKKNCPKNCFGVDPEKDVVDNYKDGCNFAKSLVEISEETFHILNQKS